LRTARERRLCDRHNSPYKGPDRSGSGPTSRPRCRSGTNSAATASAS
jgi:hypothetical protein